MIFNYQKLLFITVSIEYSLFCGIESFAIEFDMVKVNNKGK